LPWEIVIPVIAASSGLVGVAVGGYFAAHNQKRERQQRRISEQHAEFYSPMLGLRALVLAKKELSVKITGEADSAWRKMMELAYERKNVDLDHVEKLMQERGPKFERIIEYQNRQLAQEVIPAYRKMVELFVSKMHLAEPSTIQHFSTLVEFVEIWDRWLGKSLPAEVLGQLDHSEQKLYPFYHDLFDTFARMQRALRETHRAWRCPTNEKLGDSALAVNPFAGARRGSETSPPGG
jgi:hypothetical protein